MSLFTQVRDGVVNTVVPEKYRNATPEELASQATAGLIKVASSAPGGNQTAAQIESGNTGFASFGLMPTQVGGLKITLPVLAVAGAALYFFLKKRR